MTGSSCRPNCSGTQAKLQAASRGKADVLQTLLPILADMRLALQHADQDADTVRQGVEMIWKKFEEFIRGQGLKLIPTVGERFDPARHEAMSTVPATPEYPPDTIVSEVRAGYFLEGQLLATAQVVVARAAEIDTSEKAAGQGGSPCGTSPRTPWASKPTVVS